jgi:hypothetical protein
MVTTILHTMKILLPTVSTNKVEAMIPTINNHMVLVMDLMILLVTEGEAKNMVETTMQVIGIEKVIAVMTAMETLVALILDEITIKISHHDRMKVYYALLQIPHGCKLNHSCV